MAACSGNQDSVPAALRAIEFADFGVSATRNGPGSPFDLHLYGNAEVAFPILDGELTARLALAFTKTATGYAIHLAVPASSATRPSPSRSISARAGLA